MSIADFLKETKEKYQPKEMKVELTTCSVCKHPESKYCLRCEECGRKFDKGRLIQEFDGTKL